jgi:hypothetical protein
MKFKYCLSLFLFVFLSQNASFSQSVIILTSDKQLDELQDPDKKIDMSTGFQKNIASLRDVCEAAKQRKETVLTIAFDEFFRQYRNQEGTERKLTPVMDEYIHKLKSVSDFAAKYGLGIGLSLLSPLEIGPAFAKETGDYGRWIRYSVGLRESETGKFEVQLWRELYWTNNKGKFALKLKGVKAFAFKEKDIANNRFTVVRPEDIQEIKTGVQIEEWPDTTVIPKWIPTSIKHDVSVPIQRVKIYSNGTEELKGYDRVFVMLEYETPEMDYFSPKALPYLKNVMKKYYDNGINLRSLYSDEMHLQQDWHYFNHHENGQFSNRYITDNFAKIYSEKYDAEYRDMDKYMLYFMYGPKSYNRTPYAIINSQYVMGDTYEEISKTFLFRDRYYKMLNNQVVDVFKSAKDYADSLFRCEMPTLAHASWAESPTIDLWDTGKLNKQAYQYEYTPNFLWSNTVQQAAAGCYDYFKWGEYLQPTGNDFAECGWSDRDYYGSAMAASIGILNKYPDAYAAFWGMPRVAERWKYSLVSAFGDAGAPTMDAITGHVHRDVDVLILYPMNLVAAEERFGSWITQYAYCNYITAEKLLEVGKITPDGKIDIAGRKFSTLISLFEITPAKGLLDFIDSFNKAGGKLLWFGTPPLLEGDGKKCLDKWENIFGVDYEPSVWMGQGAAGKIVTFENKFKSVPSQVILTDFIVDRIHPIKLRTEVQLAATIDGMTVGSTRNNGKGIACYFGFRPRDDQSSSLGYESRTLFEILNAAGAYPATGKFTKANDNTEYVSRTTNYLTTRFPNGTTAIVTHYRTHREDWADGFSRDDVADSIALLTNPMPSDTMILDHFKVNGHEINYEGKQLCAFNLDSKGKLISFEGHQCDRVEIDKTFYLLSSRKQNMISWTPASEIEMKDYNAIMKIWIDAEGNVDIPLTASVKSLKFAKVEYGNLSYLKNVNYKVKENTLSLDGNSELNGRWIYICK